MTEVTFNSSLFSPTKLRTRHPFILVKGTLFPWQIKLRGVQVQTYLHNCDLITDFMHGCSQVPCKNSGQRVSRVLRYIQVHVHAITCHERTEGEHRYSCTLSLTSALEGGWSRPRAGSFIPRTEPVLFVEGAGWAPGSVWTRVENLAPSGIRNPERPARSESLYTYTYVHT
jgi:hypothetical protein